VARFPIGPSDDRGRDRPRTVARPRNNRAGSNGDIHDLDRLSRGELRAVWTQELGDQPPATLGRDILALGIAYARQERRQGGLTKPVAKELDWLLEQTLRSDRADKPAAASMTSLPRSGTVLVREWQGATHHIIIVKDGFLWNGSTYRSLSGIARAITGTNWNGPRFFGMREVNGKERENRRGG
jgi:Protein of unknown function (DUF2924)